MNLQYTATMDVIETLDTLAQARACATRLFHQELTNDLRGQLQAQAELRGHDLIY